MLPGALVRWPELGGDVGSLVLSDRIAFLAWTHCTSARCVL
jgi:hypothetical protein